MLEPIDTDTAAAPPLRRARPLPALLADVTDIPVFAPTRRDVLVRWLAISAVFGLYLLNAGSFGLWDPWETHYGEVTRHMVETYDWVNPWWGYARKIGTEPIAGEPFYSKPIYIFWAEASFIRLIGYSDWALRLPLALLGASMCGMVYLTIERILGRTQALCALAVVALSPFVYMVSRQAQTDMPFVATMTIGLLFFALAYLSKRLPLTRAGFVRATLAFTAFLLLNLGPQLAIIAGDLHDENAGAGQEGMAALLSRVQQNGVYHLIFYVPVVLAILGSVLWPIWRARRQQDGWNPAFVDRNVRRFFLLSGYMMLAQATYAKGLLGFMLPGAILLLYLVVTRDWRLLARTELARGIPLFFVTVLPWYVAMFCRHGMPYYNRFFIHDHFNRVGAGVHQIDTGTFEYFVKWLGFGLFPWAGFIPLALVAAVGWTRTDRHVADAEAPVAPEAAATAHVRTLLFLWFLMSFFLFTLSSTRFHHYILPGVPALGVLIGLYLYDLRRDEGLQARVAVALALALFVAVLANLTSDYQNLRSLFTYKYDRPLPENLPLDWQAAVIWPSDRDPVQTWVQTPFGRHVGPMVAHVLSWKWMRYDAFWWVVGPLGGLALLAMLWHRLRTAGLWVLTATAALTAFWALNHYMPSLAPHWSQKYLFEAYYEDCHLHPNPPSIQEAYTPLVRRAGLDFVADFFDAKNKRVCREDIISWLITWRGETYYSNNEIRPLNKATQFIPYLKEMNRGKTFYALLERGRTSGFAQKLRAESKKLQGDGDAGFVDISDWNVDLVSNDSAYFVLARCVPVRSGVASDPATRDAAEPVRARLPSALRPGRPGARPAPEAAPGEKSGSSPNPNF